MHKGLVQVPFALEDSPQIEMGKAVALIAPGLEGHAQPRDGVIQLALFQIVGADVVVGIAELRIQIDGPVAILNGGIEVLFETLGPAPKGVGLCGWADLDGIRVELDGLVQITLHVELVGLGDHIHGLLAFGLTRLGVFVVVAHDLHDRSFTALASARASRPARGCPPP